MLFKCLSKFTKNCKAFRKAFKKTMPLSSLLFIGQFQFLLLNWIFNRPNRRDITLLLSNFYFETKSVQSGSMISQNIATFNSSSLFILTSSVHPRHVAYNSCHPFILLLLYLNLCTERERREPHQKLSVPAKALKTIDQ